MTTKTISLILVTLLSVACGGEPFGSATNFGPDASAAGASDNVAGTASSAGTTGASGGSAGVGVTGDAGTASGGSVAEGGAAMVIAGAGSSAGAAPTVCALDRDAVTAALPSIITWTKWSSKTATACVSCADNKCFENTSVRWNAPVMDVPGTLSYGMVGGGAVRVGIGDKTCAIKDTCGVELLSVQLDVHVTQQANGWIVTASEPHVFFNDNMCLETASSEHDLGNITQAMNDGFDQALGAPLVGLKIPCK